MHWLNNDCWRLGCFANPFVKSMVVISKIPVFPRFFPILQTKFSILEIINYIIISCIEQSLYFLNVFKYLKFPSLRCLVLSMNMSCFSLYFNAKIMYLILYAGDYSGAMSI